MAEWRKCTISDLGTVVGGATPSTNDIENYEKGTISWITPRDLSVLKGRYIQRGERNITEKGLKSCSSQLMPVNTVLFSSRAPIGYVAIAKNELCTNQGMKSVIPNKSTDALFLYYLLKYNKDAIEQMGCGTTFKEVSGTVMKDIVVKVPADITDQQKIARILGSIDDKIESNTAINDNLQQELCLIYEHIMNQAKKGLILGTHAIASELSEITTGREDANFADTNGKYKFFTCSSETLKCNHYAFNSSSILIAGNGEFNVKHFSGKFNAYQRTYVLTPKQEHYGLLYLACLYQIKSFKSSSAGSIVKFITKGDIDNIPVFIPDDGTYLIQMNKLLDLQEMHLRENEKLLALRDFLLPLLMNGQATIAE